MATYHCFGCNEQYEAAKVGDCPMCDSPKTAQTDEVITAANRLRADRAARRVAKEQALGLWIPKVGDWVSWSGVTAPAAGQIMHVSKVPGRPTRLAVWGVTSGVDELWWATTTEHVRPATAADLIAAGLLEVEDL